MHNVVHIIYMYTYMYEILAVEWMEAYDSITGWMCTCPVKKLGGEWGTCDYKVNKQRITKLICTGHG